MARRRGPPRARTEPLDGGVRLTILVPGSGGFEERRVAVPGSLAELDDVAERFLAALDELDARVAAIESRLDEDDLEPAPQAISDTRREVIELRRALAQTRDAVHSAMLAVDPETAQRLRGVYDELVEATESAAFLHELLAGARDYYHAKIAERQNDVMKRLTVIASVLLLPTFIVGVYGQNFDHMPELHWRLGYVWSWSLVVATTLVQLAFFRRRGWL